MRKDALLFKRPAKDELTKGIEFEIEKLPAGKVVKLDLAAEQAYQLATICNTVDVGGKKETHLQAIVLPKQDGKMKVLQLNEGQEVQLRLFMGKDSKEPAVVTGGPVAANLVQGKVVNWMKPILNELDKPATKGAKNDLAAPNYNFKLVDAYLDAKAKGKLPAELKNTAVYLDGAIEQALAAQVKK